MNPGIVPPSWQHLIVLDERTVQLNIDGAVVRIIGPAQQAVERLRGHYSPDATRTEGDAHATSTERAATPATATLQAPPHAANAVVQARRKLAAVLIEGLPAPARLLAAQLTRLRVGMLLLCDETPVSHGDIPQGYSPAAIGIDRASALRRSCLQQQPEAAVAVRSSQKQADWLAPEPVDIHILFTEGAVEYRRLAEAASRAQLLLPVVRDDAGWRIGPLLSKELGPCPQCLLLRGQAKDPHWETLQSELASAATQVDLPPESPEVSAVVASLVGREVQLAVDGQVIPQTAERMLSLDAVTSWIGCEPVSPHPECECRLRASASANTARRASRGGSQQPLTEL